MVLVVRCSPYEFSFKLIWHIPAILNEICQNTFNQNKVPIDPYPTELLGNYVHWIKENAVMASCRLKGK